MKYKAYVQFEDTFDPEPGLPISRTDVQERRNRAIEDARILLFSAIVDRLTNPVSLTVHVEDGDELALYTPKDDVMTSETTRND